jgi:hypothetical protein
VSESVSKRSLRTYAVAFVFALLAAGMLLASGLTRSLSANFSLASIIFSIVAVVLGVLVIRR